MDEPEEVVSGYSEKLKKLQVCYGDTGHVGAVQVHFGPHRYLAGMKKKTNYE
jgi:hypothetical protein